MVDPTKLHLSRRYRVGYRSVPLGLRALSVQYAHQTPLYKNLGSCTSKAGEASGGNFLNMRASLFLFMLFVSGLRVVLYVFL